MYIGFPGNKCNHTSSPLRSKVTLAEMSAVHSRRWMAAVAACLLIASWSHPTGVRGFLTASNDSSVMSSLSPTLTSIIETSSLAPPFTSSSPSPSSSPSHSPSPSPSSSPSPPSPTPFLEYVLNNTLYIRIEKMVIFIFSHESGYYNLTVEEYPELKTLASAESANQSDRGAPIRFWKYYKYNKTHQSNRTFSFNFTFKLESSSSDQTWYISSFTHRNSTAEDNSTCLFEYTGLSHAVHAPSDTSFYCSDMIFHGDCVDGPKSQVHFTGLRIQAFQLKGKTPSSTYLDCGAKDGNNSIINMVVGSVVGSTLAIALLVIVVTLLVKLMKKKVRWRGYNLLDD